MSYIFGIHAVDSLLRNNPRAVQRLCLQAGRNDKRIAGLQELASNQGIVVERLSKEALEALVSGRHQGAVAQTSATGGAGSVAGEANLWREADLLSTLKGLQHPALLLVLDGVTDPHNLGACLRSADAAGVDAVIVPRDKSADLTPVVRKVACGAAETVPFVRVTNLSRTLQALQQLGVWIYGTAGEAEASVYASDLASSAAIVMGGEGGGLRRLTRENCDYLMRLPMAGSVSSLNVSVATGICLFEAVRQRQATK
tara:strand:- start:36806 stop:37573 length:768 start_codon:yes stop_codon:yes gene_type:complete